MTSTPPLTRRRLVGSLLLAGLAPAARADSFPTRPLHLVVPFPPGGPTDLVARPLAAQLGPVLGESLIVDNRGGAGGGIGAAFVAQSPPDGYTLLMGTVGTHAINASLYQHLDYDPVADFTPLALVASAPVAVVVDARSPWKTLADLVAAARAKPKAVFFGSAGNGTPGHLTGAMFARAAHIQLQHVPYKGSAPALSDLLAGQFQVLFDPLQSVLPHIASGGLRALAVSGARRAGVLPEVPTIAEQGYPGFETTAWWAVFGPAHLPAAVVSTLEQAIARVVRAPAFSGGLEKMGVQIHTDPALSLAAFQQAEIAKWRRAVHDAGVTLE